MTPRSREASLERLRAGTYDLLVVGAGIVGSRVALDAARAGLRVALVEARDFGGGTSSESSKLVHGGLRYLATRQLRLVRQAQRERNALQETVAPGLVWSMPLVLAATRTGTSRVLLPVATATYAALAGRARSPTRRLTPREAVRLVPALDAGAVTSATLVHEGQTNDARLTLATVRAAAAAGADVANYLGVVSLEQARGRLVAALVQGLPAEGLLTIRARAVVNATGAWIDRLRRLEDAGARPLVRLSRGTNLTLRHDEGWAAGLALFDRSRSVLAAPWHGLLLLGATDTPYDGDPSAVAPTAEDVEMLLGSLAGVVQDDVLRSERVLCAFAGLRALGCGDGSTASASRGCVLALGRRGMVSVAGGKLTTHRLISLATLRALPGDVRPRRLGLGDAPITQPVVPTAGLARLREAVGVERLRYLVELYGGEVGELAAEETATAPIAPGGPDVWAQAFRARDLEWALSVEDVVRRRTTLELRGLATPDVRLRLAESLGLPQTVGPRASGALV